AGVEGRREGGRVAPSARWRGSWRSGSAEAAGCTDRGAHRRLQAPRPGRMSEGAAGGRSALVLTASDRSAAGTRDDQSGDALSERLEGLGFAVERAVVADDRTEIAARLRDAAEGHDPLLTNRGTSTVD